VFRFAHANGDAAAGLDSADRSALDLSYGELGIAAEVPEGTALLGVRPEDLVVRGEGNQLGTVTLDVVEHMGHETIAHFALAGGGHVARLPADAGVQPGDRLPLTIRPGAYHLFSAADGRRLN
jgi:multiple sugar transport system ATP-binding protein